MGNATMHEANAPSWCQMPTQPHPTPQQHLRLGRTSGRLCTSTPSSVTPTPAAVLPGAEHRGVGEPRPPGDAQRTRVGQGQGAHLVAFQSFLMLSSCDRRSHMVFKTSFPSSSTKHWPVKTVMESAGTGQEVEMNVARAAGLCRAVALQPAPVQGTVDLGCPCPLGTVVMGKAGRRGQRAGGLTQRRADSSRLQPPAHPLWPGTGR